MIRELSIWIPGVVASVNTFRRRSARERMSTIKRERDKAYMYALKAVREKYPAGEDTWTGPTSIDFEIRTSRVLKDKLQVGASLKHTQDSLCGTHSGDHPVLPLGDGHDTPYVWREPTQVKVKTRKEEGVLVTIKELP